MDQEIRFCRRPDGVNLAYAVYGQGPPLVVISPWSHIELEWESPWMGQVEKELAPARTIIRIDRHGTGLSDRDRMDFSLDADVLDLETVADHLALDRFAIMGLYTAGPIAIAYAVSHPERVSELILRDAHVRGDQLAPPAAQEIVLDAVRKHWGLGSKTVATLMAPGLDARNTEWLARYNRRSVSAEAAAGIIEAGYTHDVRDLARRVSAPTLILQLEVGAMVRKEAAREAAAMIEGAAYAVVDGGPGQVRAIREFLGIESETRAPLTVLFTDRESSTALGQRLGDERAYELQRRQDDVTRAALRKHAGNEIKHTGDGLMATFVSASAAIACAIDIQRSLPDDEGRVRIGLACGEVVHDKDDVFGATVQLAARVCDRARPGQILVPEAVRQLAGSRGVDFSDGRAVALKGFAERVRIYEVRWAADAENG